MGDSAATNPGGERGRTSFLTLPNLLTLSRIPLGALVWIRPRDPAFVLGIMAVAGVTDVLDGWVERRRHPGRRVETVGAWLDPLCDKLFMLSVLIALAVARSLPFWMVPLIALRELLQALAAVAVQTVPQVRRRFRFTFGATVLGKSTTVAQFITIGAILWNRPGQIPLVLATAGLGLGAAWVYIRRARLRPSAPLPR